MTQEEKELLLKDLCTRLPYDCIVECSVSEEAKMDAVLIPEDIAELKEDKITIKPYLRPMSSMTEEEFKELVIVTELMYDQLELVNWGGVGILEFYLSEIPQYCVIKVFDWLNKKQFDYRGLIEQGLALEAPEGMYNE